MIKISQEKGSAGALFSLARHVFPDRRVELKDQIDQARKVAREIKVEKLLLEMLLLSSLPEHKLESKKLVSQMIKYDSNGLGFHRDDLEYLEEHIFSKYALDLKEEISQIIKVYQKMKPLSHPGIHLKRLAEYILPKQAPYLKDQISEMIKVSQEIKEEVLLEYLARYVFPEDPIEFKEQIFQTLVALTKFKIYDSKRTLRSLNEVLFKNTEMKELAYIVERFIDDPSESEWRRFKEEISALNGQKNCRSFLSRLPLRRWWPNDF